MGFHRKGEVPAFLLVLAVLPPWASSPLCAAGLATSAAATSQPAEGDPMVPVVYGGHFDPLPLSGEQIRQIVADARRLHPKDADVWFVLVLVHLDSKHGPDHYNTIVYFAPEVSTPRLHKGKFVYVTDPSRQAWYAEVGRSLRVLDSQAASQPDPVKPYVHVSAHGQVFAEKGAAPPLTMLPFPAPKGFSDEETVDIADFVRSGPPGPGHPIDPSFPIRSVERCGVRICIETGWVEGPLSGRGQRFTIERKADGYRLVEMTGEWVAQGDGLRRSAAQILGWASVGVLGLSPSLSSARAAMASSQPQCRTCLRGEWRAGTTDRETAGRSRVMAKSFDGLADKTMSRGPGGALSGEPEKSWPG